MKIDLYHHDCLMRNPRTTVDKPSILLESDTIALINIVDEDAEIAVIDGVTH